MKAHVHGVDSTMYNGDLVEMGSGIEYTVDVVNGLYKVCVKDHKDPYFIEVSNNTKDGERVGLCCATLTFKKG